LLVVGAAAALSAVALSAKLAYEAQSGSMAWLIFAGCEGWFLVYAESSGIFYDWGY
jgi:hypothetical protein